MKMDRLEEHLPGRKRNAVSEVRSFKKCSSVKNATDKTAWLPVMAL